MIRSFLVASVTVVAVAGVGPLGRVAAQNPPPPPQVLQVPVDIVGALPGVNLELYINSGKSGDITVSVSGGASWVLDMSNFGKTRVTIYVDVCKDGKIVKVMFVTGNGQPPPKDEDCDRRLVAVGFQSDCGVTRISINISNWGSRIVGCGSMFTQPKVYGPVVGGIVVGGLLITNGGGGTTTTASTPTSTTTTTTVTVTTPTAPTPAPVVPTPTPTNTTPPTTPVAPVDFNVTASPSWIHPGGNTSIVCVLIITNPPQPGGAWVITISGPGVRSGGSNSGVLNAAGRAAPQAVIDSFGIYTAAGSVVVGGVTKPFQGTANVNAQNGACTSA